MFIVGATSSCKKEDENTNKQKSTTDEPDPCTWNICANGGTCVNGACLCPAGFTGSNCAFQITPSKITIDSIHVNGWPGTNGGVDWDPTSRPDVYITFDRGGSLLYTSPIRPDIDSNSTISIFTNIDIEQPTANHRLRIYDFDSVDSSAVIGSIFFHPYHSQNLFPQVVIVQDSTINNLKFKLYCRYVF